MQILLTLRPDRQLVVPYNYQYQLQSAVYAMLGRAGESDFWHDCGYGDITKYKGFCFSGLEGKYKNDAQNRKLIFENNVYLEIRSYSFEFIDAFQRALEINPDMQLFDTRLSVVSASLSNVHIAPGIIRLKAVTPVVVHTTDETGYTNYYSPDDDVFFIRLANNISRKYEAITNKAPDEFFIRPAGEFKKTVTKYKNTVICGYTGSIEIKTNSRMAEFVYNTGLGEKNAQGFGFVKLIKN